MTMTTPGPNNHQAERRAGRLAWFALFWILALALRLIHLQVLDHKSASAKAQRQQTRKAQVASPRAPIFDRGGIPLAITVPSESVSVNASKVPDTALAVAVFASIFNWDARRRQEMAAVIEKHRTLKPDFLWIERGVTLEQSDRLRVLNLSYVTMHQDARREYPAGPLAAHVVGGVAQAQVEKRWLEVGAWGVERKHQARLEGRAGSLLVHLDSRLQEHERQVQVAALAGEPVHLTIDRRIQFLCERAIAKAVRDNQCESGSIVILRPQTGEVLAIANYPSFDPNTPARKSELRWRKNIAVEESFEPGSVFKIVTLAAALDLGRVQPHSGFDCENGRFVLFKRPIHDHVSHGWLTAREILAKSSNIGAIKIALTLKREEFLGYIRAFGFGRRTGIELPAESPGLVWPASAWTPSSVGSVAMGHELRASPLQLAQAVAVIANGGRLVRPTILREPRLQRVALPQVIRPETSVTMRRLMEEVVVHPGGTGRAAKLDTHTAAGKTGSAQVLEGKHYVHGRYNASFAGFAPVNNPQIVVVVTLNQVTRLAGAAAAPVFREVAQPTLAWLDVERDLPDRPAAAPAALPPPPPDLALSDLADPALASAPDPEVPGDESEDLPGTRPVPDWRGLTLRAAQARASSENWPVEFTGSGIVRRLDPAPGRKLRPGAILRVQLAK
jgi:cell division protein FtsI (penicillin-binding protein 3)